MKIVLYVLGVLFILGGVVWFLQGINVLPGSFMSGQSQWAVRGGLLALLGIALLVFASRMRARGA